MIERGIQALTLDRVHGSGYLARKALGILAITPTQRWAEVAARLVEARPEMPTIAAAVTEAMAAGDVRRVIRRADAERRRVARSAMRALARRRVVTLGNSSLVARAVVYASPALVQVVVDGPEDEGHFLASDLRAAAILVATVGPGAVDAEIAVVGCEAVFEDGMFVARRGTAALVERLPTLLLIDRWKRVEGPAPVTWDGAGRFEVVSGAAVRAPA